MLRTGTLALALSLIGSLVCNFTALAQEEGAAQAGAAQAGAAQAGATQEESVQEGAKGLFFEQMKKPQQSINTGMRYWIELDRKGKISRVSNKQAFYGGDHIKFHVSPNIDGYAYILLRSGSRGEQSVLFPDQRLKEDNQVAHGREYDLPADGYLTFDSNPGTEKLTLLLSRTPIDAEAFLMKPSEQPTVIASAETGSKDLIPAKVLVVYCPKTPANPNVDASGDKKLTSAPQEVATAAKTATPPAHRTTARHPARRTTLAVAGNNEEGVTTVVRKDPNGVLFVDVALNHK